MISSKKANMIYKDETLPANLQWVPNFKVISQRFGGLIIAIGFLVLIGWQQDIEALKSIVPGLASMKSMTAMLFVLSGVSLWLYARQQAPFFAQACAFVVLLGGLLTLGEYIFGTDFGIDQLLFRDTAAGVIHPGRMSPATALSFVLIGFGLTLLDRLPGKWFHQAPVIVALAISILALIGYLYDVSSFYQLGVYASMALHTAFCFILLSLGIFFARPERGIMQTILADTAGGQVLRRLLPVTLLLPVFLGWIRLWGQHAGLYDTAFGLAIMVISLITTTTILIWINARQLTDIDRKRKQVDDSLRASELRFRNTLESMMEGCQIIGYDWRYIYINPAAETQNRRPTEELLGKIYMDMWPGIESTAVYAGLRECMEERLPQHLVTEFIFPDGAMGWFELSIQPVPDGIFILSSDITERKQAEQALLEREMKLATLLDLLPVGISILDTERKVSYTNRALKEMLDLSEEELLKGTYTNRTYLRADGTVMPVNELARTRAFSEKREINNIETGVVKEDNSIVWTNASAVPVNFPDWNVVLVTSDITERRQAQERFRLAIEAAPNAIVMVDQQGQIILVNSQAEKYFGYDRVELVTKSIDDLVPARFRGHHAKHRSAFFSEPQARAMGVGRDLYGLRKDGMEFPVEIGLAPINTQEGMLVLATIVDITERKKREEETRKLEERFSIAFRASPAGLTITTLADGKFVDVNESYLRMLGYDRKEVIGHTAVELNMLSAEERAKPVQQLRKQGRIRNIELQLQAKSGQLFNVLFSSEQIELNGVDCILTIIMDITDRKQAEQKISRLNAELEAKVALRTMELAEANKQLHQLSILDELTGLHNRRGFHILAEEQLLLAKRTGCNLLLFYADLDDLKRVNDQQGHDAGDQAIVTVAQALNKTFRSSDIKARLGGDEFIVLTIDCMELEAPPLLARLQERLAQEGLSMSVGVVTFDTQSDLSMADLITRADEAMYEVKMSKRGRHGGTSQIHNR
jgi:diguanylate cyclase (GGDEF)-like protein/PAS domain S-box-containing protein